MEETGSGRRLETSTAPMIQASGFGFEILPFLPSQQFLHAPRLTLGQQNTTSAQHHPHCQT